MMILFPTIFKMKTLKQLFFKFFAAVIVLVLVCFAIMAVIKKPDSIFIDNRTGSWLLFLLLFVVSYLQGQVSKKNLKTLRADSNPETLFYRYTQFYKKRLFLNLIPVFLCAVLFLVTFANTFFYLLLLQIVFAFIFYPRKKQIKMDLPDQEIVFN